jgi:hypothetical protein
MSENTKIEWCDHTFNPLDRLHQDRARPAINCYAKSWDRRFAVSGHAMHWGAGQPASRTSIDQWGVAGEVESTGSHLGMLGLRDGADPCDKDGEFSRCNCRWAAFTALPPPASACFALLWRMCLTTRSILLSGACRPVPA